jgi:spore coat polysaccharide biosynthesis protein SpsF
MKREIKRRDKIVAVIQARMESSRLPGKILLKLAGKPMLDHVIERLKQSRLIDFICVATTTNPKDDTLISYLKKKKIPYFRGSEDDIVSRLYHAGLKYKADVLVRVFGDCPLMDPGLIDKMIKRFIKAKADFATTAYFSGISAEVYRLRVLKEIFDKADDPFYRQFPRDYVKNNSRIKMITLSPLQNLSHIRLSVDYPEDVKVVTQAIKDLSSQKGIFGVEEIVEYYQKNKSLFNKNIDLERDIEYKQELESRKKLKRR